MNIQLVDSLILVIESLTPEECLLFQEKLSGRGRFRVRLESVEEMPGFATPAFLFGHWFRFTNRGPMRLSYFGIIQVCRIAI